MSLAYNDTSTHKGIIQKIERLVYGMDAVGRISGNTTLLKQWTADVNSALDRAFSIIFKADGRWQFDDSNHTDYPIITTNLVANQRDYSFITDGNSNLILSIKKVLIADANGIFKELDSIDVPWDRDTEGFWNGQNSTGVPVEYDKNANAIFLNPIPSYSYTAGMKLYISREGSYFAYTDTTKKAGFSGLYHDYLAVYPSWQYALANGLANQIALERMVLQLEAGLKSEYSRRAEDDVDVLSPSSIDSE